MRVCWKQPRDNRLVQCERTELYYRAQCAEHAVLWGMGPPRARSKKLGTLCGFLMYDECTVFTYSFVFVVYLCRIHLCASITLPVSARVRACVRAWVGARSPEMLSQRNIFSASYTHTHTHTHTHTSPLLTWNIGTHFLASTRFVGPRLYRRLCRRTETSLVNKRRTNGAGLGLLHVLATMCISGAGLRGQTDLLPQSDRNCR